MRRPRGWKRGDWLLVDDESGFVIRHSDAAKRWDGALVARSQNEERNPQEFVKARRDPAPLRDVRPQAEVSGYCPSPFRVVGDMVIDYLVGPGGRLLAEQFSFAIATSQASADIPPVAMSVGCTFIVYPD